MSGLVWAAQSWETNAEMVRDLAQLGYLTETGLTLDPTFENGTWWNLWRPITLITRNRRVDGSDFRRLPLDDGMFDQIAFDPPYVCPGGVKTSTVKDFHDRYGMAEGRDEERLFRTPLELQLMINAGLVEMRRLVRPPKREGRHKIPGGIVVVKCKDYVWGGKLWSGTTKTQAFAESMGFETVDRFTMVGRPGPQSQTTQEHARHNESTAFVFRRVA